MIDKKVANLVRSNIESSLRNYNISSEVLLKNNNMCISVHDEDIDLWVRLLPVEDNKVSVDFSTVQLSDKLQNKGIFTSIFNNLKSSEVIGVLKISSVCTRCMTKWCVKNGLKTVDGFDYVYGIPRHLYDVKTDFSPRTYYWRYKAWGTYNCKLSNQV